MSDLQQRLTTLREDSAGFFAHARTVAGDDCRYVQNQLAPEDRQRGEEIRRKLVKVMREVLSLIQGAPMLEPTASSSHKRNTRLMTSALSFKRYECWGPRPIENQDILIAVTEAGEREVDVPVREAEDIFWEAFRNTIEFLDLADPVGDDTATEVVPPERASRPKSAGKGRKRSPKPDYETATRVAEIVARVAPAGDWRLKVDEVCDALDAEGVPCPRTWPKHHNALLWADRPEKSLAVKAIQDRLDKTTEAAQTPRRETLS